MGERGTIGRERAQHRRPLVDLGEQRHLAIMQFDEALDDGKPQARAAMVEEVLARLMAVLDSA